jgi:hypothetical protein
MTSMGVMIGRSVRRVEACSLPGLVAAATVVEVLVTGHRVPFVVRSGPTLDAALLYPRGVIVTVTRGHCTGGYIARPSLDIDDTPLMDLPSRTTC